MLELELKYTEKKKVSDPNRDILFLPYFLAFRDTEHYMRSF